jgi:hypothetical protein
MTGWPKRCARTVPAEMRRRAVILASLALALAVAGCTSTDKDLNRELLAERLETMTIVTPAELAAEPPGSPSRAVLTLWRAVQFRNPEGALEHVSPAPTPGQLKGFEDFIVVTGAQTAATTKPRILDVKENGAHAEVQVEFIRHQKVGDQVRSRSTGRLTVELVRTRGRWLVLWRRAADQIPAAIS